MELDLIDEKIKRVNKKVMPISLLGALFMGTGIVLFGPALPFSILFAIVFSVITCAAIYQFLFYLWGREVMDEAKKRRRYLYKIFDTSSNDLPSCFEEIKTCSSTENIHTDLRYHYLSCNIHNDHH